MAAQPDSPVAALAALIDELPVDLRNQALTHSSWTERRVDSFERLAFLGDSVLGLAVATRTYESFEKLAAGGLTKVHNQAVSGVSCAEVGTLLLEFGTLSKLTHKPIYYDKAKNALVQLYKRRSKIGLVGDEIDVETGEWTSRASHVGGAIDSYYEYLLKCARLFWTACGEGCRPPAGGQAKRPTYDGGRFGSGRDA